MADLSPREPGPHCVACGSTRLKDVGYLPFRMPGEILQQKIVKCRQCGTYLRTDDFSVPEVRSHYDIAQYSDLSLQSEFRRSRAPFFAYIIELGELHSGCPASQTRVLDVGASYGHMIDQYRERGATCTAIEISTPGQTALRKKNVETLTSAEELPADAMFDVITTIDSFYYFQDPGRLLRVVAQHLTPDGVLIIRISNRTLLLNLLRMVHMSIPDRVFGDIKTHFTYRGIRTLLESSGYRIVSVLLRERGKRSWTWARRLYYTLSFYLSKLTGLKLTPGLIIVCRHAET